MRCRVILYNFITKKHDLDHVFCQHKTTTWSDQVGCWCRIVYASHSESVRRIGGRTHLRVPSTLLNTACQFINLTRLQFLIRPLILSKISSWSYDHDQARLESHNFADVRQFSTTTKGRKWNLIRFNEASKTENSTAVTLNCFFSWKREE